MRYLRAIFLVIAALCLIAAPVFAIAYNITLTVLETGSVSHTMLSTIFDVNNSFLVSNGFMSSSANDTNVTEAGVNVKYLVADNKTIVSSSLAALAQKNYSFTTGNTPADRMSIVPGYGGYFTIADTAGLEWGSNGSNTLTDVFVDTTAGASKNLVSHSDATNGGIDLFVSPTVSGNITGRRTTVTSATIDILPNAAGDYANITTATPGVAHYLNVDDPVATPDDAATTVDTSLAPQTKDAYNIESPTFLGFNQVITSVKVYYRGCTNQAGVSSAWAQPGLRLGGVEQMGTDTQLAFSTVWTNYNQTIARPGGGTWVTTDFASLQAVIGVRDSVGWTAFITQVYVKITYTYETYTDVSATGIATGEHDIALGFTSPFLGINVGASLVLPVTTGLVLNAPLWQTEESSDPFTSIDSSAISCNPSAGAVWSASGYTFGGADMIDCGNPASLQITSNISVEVWFTPSSVAAGTRSVISKQQAAVGGYYIDQAATSIRFGFQPLGVVTSSVSLSAGQTYHIVGVYNSVTSRLYIYVNNTETSSAVVGAPANSATNLYAGRYGNSASQYIIGAIHEVRIYSTILSATQVLQNYNATKAKYLGTTTSALYSKAGSIPNSTANWTIMSTAVPYVGSVEMSVGGVRQILFDPNSIISGTVLPDREATGGTVNGAITWGVNIGGISTSMSSMTSSSSAILPSTTEEPNEILPPVTVTDWHIAPDVGGSLATNPLRPFVIILSDTTSLTERQAWVLLGIVFVLFVLVITAKTVRGHHIITGVATGLAIAACVVMTVFPLYTLVLIIIAIVVGALAERSPSL